MKKMTYNKFNTIEMPTFILSSVAHVHYGVINNIDPASVQSNFNMNSAQECSFEVKKYVNGVICDLWDKIVPLRYVYIPEHHEYYKMDVVIEEGDDTTKKCTLTSASEYELSNKIIQSLEINSDVDYAYQEYYYDTKEYKRVIFYNPEHPDCSLLHKVLGVKTPDWSVAYVAPTLVSIQRTFSISKQSVYDILVNTIGKEIECLFVFDSVNRTISAYDLLNTCKNHYPYYRGNFTDFCPKCGEPITSPMIEKGYGKETGIYISYENYSDRMTVDGDENSVKNCFFVAGGDDKMTNMIKLLNPTMNNYIYNFSAMDYNDMPTELVDKIRDYREEYASKQAEYEALVTQYSDAVDNYWYYKTSMMPRNNSTRWDSENQYSASPNTRIYTKTLPAIYYMQCIQGGISGSKEPECTHTYEGEKISDGTVVWEVKTNIISTGSSAQQAALVQQYLRNNIVEFVGDLPTESVINTSVRNIAALGLSQYFKIELADHPEVTITNNKWQGKLTITNYANAEDVDTRFYEADLKSCVSKDDYSTYLLNKLRTRMQNETNTFTTIFKIKDDEQFKATLTEYSLDRLTSFHDSYEGTISILQQQGVGDPKGDFHGIPNVVDDPTDSNYPGMYNEIYLPYFNRCLWIEEEMKVRDNEVKEWEDKMNTFNNAMNEIAELLDMEKFFNDDRLWKMFYGYVRESDYQNSNYISGNQSDAEVLADAKVLLGLANEELRKACELQYTLSDTLKNLLNTEGFKNFRDQFELGDYIICKADEELYKLRLIQVSYKYDSPDELSVSFSNVSKVQNYFSDVQSVLNQASSMTSSYQNTVNQVDKNNYITANVSEWMEQGLNTATTRIKNNNKEEVTCDNRGVIAKVYDDVTGIYGKQQVRITHDMIAFTNDNWLTTRTAIGLLPYNYYDSESDTWKYREGYGMISEFVNSGTIIGSDIIAGHIYSDNFKNSPAQGSHINLNDGSFTMGSGALKWDATNGLYVNGSGTFTGTVEAGTIHGGSIDIGSNHEFTVANTGAVTCKNITVTGGTVNIGNNDNFTISAQGDVVGKNIIVDGGRIGGNLNVNSTGIYSSTLKVSEDVFGINPLIGDISKGGSGGVTLWGSSMVTDGYQYANISAISPNTKTESARVGVIKNASGNNIKGFRTDEATDGTVTNYFIASSSGNIRYTGDIQHTSSRKIKENIGDISITEMEKIYDLRPVKYDLINGNKNKRGFIAEEVLEVLPNLVSETGMENSPYSLNDMELIPYLVKCVQTLKKELEEIKGGN